MYDAIAHSKDELRKLLQQLGLTTVRKAALVQRLPGDQDACIIFGNTKGLGRSVAFTTNEIAADVAEEVIRELTRLVQRTAWPLGPRLVTFFVTEEEY